MKLLDLDPKWIMKDGKRIGFTFLSPKGGSYGKRSYRQSCFPDPPSRRDQMQLFAAMHGEDVIVQGCNPNAHWQIAGGIDNAAFETISITPSLDGSPGGLWHGFITNGLIVGGI